MTGMQKLSLYQLIFIDVIAGITHGSSLNYFEPYSYYEIDPSIMNSDTQNGLAIYLLDISQVGGNILGCIFVALLQFWRDFAREDVLAVASIFCMLFSALQIVLHYIWRDYALFIAVNVMQGVFTSILVVYVPVWLSELSSEYIKQRGYLLVIFQLSITIGIFLNVITCSLMPMPGYTTIGGLFGFYFYLLLFFAFSVLFSFLIINMRGNCERRDPTRPMRISDLRHKHYKYPIILALLIGLLQQFSGLNPMIFNKDIMGDHSEYRILLENRIFNHQLINSLLNLLGIIYALPFIEKFGRRTMLKFGEWCIIVTQAGLFITNTIYSVGCSNGTLSSSGCSISATIFQSFVTMLVFAFEISSGPLYHVIVAEYFPRRMRVFLSAVALGINQAANLFNQSLYAVFDDNYCLHLMNATVSMVLLLAVLRVMPESKGMSLEEIEDVWDEFETCRKLRI